MHSANVKHKMQPNAFVHRVYIPKALKNVLATQLMDNAFPDHRLNGILCV